MLGFEKVYQNTYGHLKRIYVKV